MSEFDLLPVGVWDETLSDFRWKIQELAAKFLCNWKNTENSNQGDQFRWIFIEIGFCIIL
jgi:hypothetical protein